MRACECVMCICRTTVYYNSLCMGWPARVPLMSVVHVCNPRAEEEPEAVEGEECAAQHGGAIDIQRCTETRGE